MTTNAIRLLKKHSVLHAKEGKPFILKSGKESMTYVDVRLTALRADGLYELSSELYTTIRTLGIPPIQGRRVAGVALGGCPLATGVSLYGHQGGDDPGDDTYPVYDALYVRPEAKDHGTGKLVEGQFDPGDKVILLEDVVTSGSSTIKAIAALSEAGLNVVGVAAVLDREEGGKARIESHCPFRALVTLKELLAP